MFLQGSRFWSLYESSQSFRPSCSSELLDLSLDLLGWTAGWRSVDCHFCEVG